jgi:hypothetical protein
MGPLIQPVGHQQLEIKLQFLPLTQKLHLRRRIIQSRFQNCLPLKLTR